MKNRVLLVLVIAGAVAAWGLRSSPSRRTVW
jgi:hypothetical protein